MDLTLQQARQSAGYFAKSWTNLSLQEKTWTYISNLDVGRFVHPVYHLDIYVTHPLTVKTFAHHYAKP